jgi:hypothetical protein
VEGRGRWKRGEGNMKVEVKGMGTWCELEEEGGENDDGGGE